MLGRAIWMIIQWRGLRQGFLSIYVSNHESAKATFWSQLADVVPSVDAQCVVGDFNMIDTLEDKQGNTISQFMGHNWQHGRGYA